MQFICTEVHMWSQAAWVKEVIFFYSLKCNHKMKYGIYMYIIEWWMPYSSMRSFTCCQILTAGRSMLWPYPRNNNFTIKLWCVFIFYLRGNGDYRVLIVHICTFASFTHEYNRTYENSVLLLLFIHVQILFL